MKIGIISLFDLNNVNFGNRLQAYALNKYLREFMPDDKVVSLYFTDCGEKIITADITFPQRIMQKIKSILRRLRGDGIMISEVDERMRKLNDFSENNMSLIDHPWTWEELTKSDFDVLIVGSDVIWGQSSGVVNRRAFLDFEAAKPFARISYAASFEKDLIPAENVKDVNRCLNRFQAISVREKSSINLLKSIGVEQVKYVCDPTLLISEEQWKRIEKKPTIVDGNYLFAYLLGRSRAVRDKVLQVARELDLSIVTIPYATGEYNRLDETFGDVKIMDCGIEEWLWLIDHASFVVSDSFHGTVFANIFKKKYLVLERTFRDNINIRMADFLQTIGEEDKMIKIDSPLFLQNLVWKYDIISDRISELREASNTYLIETLQGGF